MSAQVFAPQKIKKKLHRTHSNISKNPEEPLLLSNTKYVFSNPQKVFIKNQYINIQNMPRETNNVSSMNLLHRFLKQYSKSLSPETLILTERPKSSQYKRRQNNDRQTKEKKTAFFTSREENSSSFFNNKKKYLSSSPKNNNFDNDDDESLICLGNKIAKCIDRKPKKIEILSPYKYCHKKKERFNLNPSQHSDFHKSKQKNCII